MKQIASYIIVTDYFINKINNMRNIPPNSFLVTMDVNSLDTNIPDSEGIAAVKKHITVIHVYQMKLKQ